MSLSGEQLRRRGMDLLGAKLAGAFHGERESFEECWRVRGVEGLIGEPEDLMERRKGGGPAQPSPVRERCG